MKHAEKVVCPFCGAEIDPDTLECPNCGNKWIDTEERELIRTVMKIPGMGEKRTKKLFEEGSGRIREADEGDLEDILKKAGIPFRIAEEVKERLETKTKLQLCPECGAFVPGDAETCPICGANLGSTGGIDFTSENVKDIHGLKDDLFLEEQKNLYLCRVCGAFLTDDDENCPVCGAPMPENRADMPLSAGNELEIEKNNIKSIQGFFGVQNPAELENVDTNILESLTELDVCSNCGAFVRPEAERCPVCGTELIPEINKEEEEAVTEEALLALEELKNELIGAQIDETIPSDSDTEYVCPQCGSPVHADTSVCPVCGIVFEDEKNEETKDELVISLEDVITEDVQNNKKESEPEIAVESSKPEDISILSEDEEERIKDKMKEEVDFIFAPVHHPIDESSDTEKEELALALEGGMDEISSPKQKPIRAVPSEREINNNELMEDSGKWKRAEDIAMAASAIGAAFLSSEYLLTNGIVNNPVLAYGTASVSIFLPILLTGAILILLDRKQIFGMPLWVNLLTALTLIFPTLPFLLWFSGTYFHDSIELDLLYMALYFAALILLWKLLKEQMNPVWIWFLGILQISAHCFIFVSGYRQWLDAGDPLPSYMLAITGGLTLSFGIYLRVDAGIRSLLATRDVLMGHRHYMNGNYDEAMRYYSRAIDRKRTYEGGYDLAYYSKGTALLSAGKTLEALKYLNRAVKANPNNEMAWNNRGIALSKLGLDEGALKSYEKALTINSAYEVAWNNKGNVLGRLERYEEALDCYDRAIELNPDYKDAWMNKGYVLIKLDRYREAKECANHVLTPSVKRRIAPAISVDIE